MKKTILLMSIAQATFAGSMGPIYDTPPPSPTQLRDWNWVAAISAGPTWSSPGKTQTFYLSPGVEKTYVANQHSKTLASGELFLGMQQTLSSAALGQLGLAVGLLDRPKLSGHIWDDTSIQFDNHRYEYRIRHNRVALKGKVVTNDITYPVQPWISASIGLGFNKASSFTNTPLIPEALPNPNFSRNTTRALSYTVGVGVQKEIDLNWQLGVGYEFADWGKSKLGRAPGQILNSGLGLSHFRTNGLMFNVTYVV